MITTPPTIRVDYLVLSIAVLLLCNWLIRYDVTTLEAGAYVYHDRLTGDSWLYVDPDSLD
jgi:hypothetical protein